MTRSVEEDLLLLRRQVEGLVADLAARAATSFRPVEWRSLDRETAREEWQRLTEFVDRLTGRYGLTEAVPACWYRHPPLVEELSALHAAWLGAYLDPAAAADAGVAWHDNLDNVLERIREWDRAGCAGGTHHDDYEALPTAPDAIDDRRAFIDADLARRPPAPSDTANPVDRPAGEPPPLQLV